MRIKFTKMHGLGNDFAIIDAVNQSIHLSSEQIVTLARRDTGIGFDQLLIVEASQQPSIDFFYRIFNANGQEVGQCGNGARCLARFVHQYGLTQKHTIQVATRTTHMQLQINPDQTVTVEMEQPNLNPEAIPLHVPQQDTHYQLSLRNGKQYIVHALSVGNPHAVMRVAHVEQAPVQDLGKQISEHKLFPEQTNVGFMQIISSSQIHLRVYERGCGETQACGSAAVAAMAVGRLYYQLDEQVTVYLPGGKLIVHWPSLKSPIFLTGPATFVYEGVLF